MVENNKYRIVYSVASLIEKRLSQTGVWIRFDSALSDPALCTGLSLARDKYVNLCTLAPPPQKNIVEAKERIVDR
jgi:hypothetical protein